MPFCNFKNLLNNDQNLHPSHSHYSSHLILTVYLWRVSISFSLPPCSLVENESISPWTMIITYLFFTLPLNFHSLQLLFHIVFRFSCCRSEGFSFLLTVNQRQLSVLRQCPQFFAMWATNIGACFIESGRVRERDSSKMGTIILCT